MKKRELFKVQGDSITRERKHCPKCGPGVFLARHKNRDSCGKCGYTEFKGKQEKQIKNEKQKENTIEENSQEKAKAEEKIENEDKKEEN